MVAYNAHDYASQLNRGEDYDKLKSAISVVIVDFEIFKDTGDYYEHIVFREKNRKIFTKAQQFYIIDLTKIPSELTEPLYMWGRLFKVETEEELRMLMEESEVMREAGEKLLELSADKEAQEIAQARKTSQWAWNHMINATEDRVREETREEERAKAEILLQQAEDEKIINARKMIQDNFTVEMIERYTGLSVEKITDLLSQR